MAGIHPLTCLTIHPQGDGGVGRGRDRDSFGSGGSQRGEVVDDRGCGDARGRRAPAEQPRRRPEEIISRKDTGRGYAGVRMVRRAARPLQPSRVTTDLLDRAAPRNRSLLLDDADDVQEAAAVARGRRCRRPRLRQLLRHRHTACRNLRPPASTWPRDARSTRSAASTTAAHRIPTMFDWSQLPDGLALERISGLDGRAVRVRAVRLPRPGRRVRARPPHAGRPGHPHDAGHRAGTPVHPMCSLPRVARPRMHLAALHHVGQPVPAPDRGGRRSPPTGWPPASHEDFERRPALRDPGAPATRPPPARSTRRSRRPRSRCSPSTRSPDGPTRAGWSSTGTARCR